MYTEGRCKGWVDHGKSGTLRDCDIPVLKSETETSLFPQSESFLMLTNFHVDSTKKKVVILPARVRCQVRRYSCTHRNSAVEPVLFLLDNMRDFETQIFKLETSRWSKF